ncbi:MAG: hypothetical protein DRP01_00955 [Archaeoglobales archaeon]|nr:MAG: hypothetical protein DRP01_00955 [Archaeoglobales archaeon]
MLRTNLINALEHAKEMTLEIANSTKHPVRKKRALEAYHQACELKDFLEHPSLYRQTDKARYERLANIFKQMMWWLFVKKPKRRRVYSIALGLYKRAWFFDLYYFIKVEQSTNATFRIGVPTGFGTFYGD